MRTRLPIAFAFIAAALTAPSFAADSTGAATGTTALETDVSSLGAANLVLPISVPPGAVGTEPALSLIYNSQAGPGALGQGFVLAGVSAISRCGASEPIDGYNGGVYFDVRDRFCLDGERLILVSQGRYGEPGTEYRTERETFTRIVAQERCGSGPCAFIATNKDGSRIEFAVTPDSRPLARGRQEVAAWQGARFVDLNGNRVEIAYQQSENQLQGLPIRIDYTVNTDAGLAANRHVEFDYRPAAQPVVKYAGGQAFLPDRRLVEIRTRVGNDVVTRYRLDYATSASTGRELLASVQACAGSTGECLGPTRFEWQAGSAAVASPNGSSTGQVASGFCSGDGAHLNSADFNGDGLQDLLCVRGEDAYALLSDGTDTTSASGRPEGRLTVPRSWCGGEHAHTAWADFDGDRRADLFCAGGDTGFKVLRSTGRDLVSPNSRPDGGLTTPPQWCDSSRSCRATITNFEGDGRAGLACSCEDGTHKVLRSDGRDVTSPNNDAQGVVATRFCASPTAMPTWLDFNGDGLADLACADQGRLSALVSDGERLASPNASGDGFLRSGWCGQDGDRLGHGDFNGDELLDFSCQSGNGDVRVLLATGSAVASPNTQADGLVRSRWCPAEQAQLEWSDYNGDGLADALCQTQSGNQLVMVSTGRELVSVNNSADGLVLDRWCDGDKAVRLSTDFNGDALADLMCGLPDGRVQTQVRAGAMPDLMILARGGLGGVDRFDYSPLTRDSVYADAGEPVYPTAAVRSPMWVVASHHREDGRGGRYSFDYRYVGARTDLLLRRWLGFEQMTMITRADGRRSIYTYSQQYPKAGFILATEQFAGNGARLSRSEFTPVVIETARWVNAVLRASERSSTYTAGEPDYVYELRNEYDQYGSQSLTLDLGEVGDPADDVFDCWQYDDDTERWRLGYPRAHKTTRTEAACRAFVDGRADAWNADADLRWDRTEYDERRNVAALFAYDDGNQDFRVQRRGYDAIGNVVSMTDWAGETSTITIEDTYRTYVASVTSPDLGDGRRLVARSEHDPRWGAAVLETDANGSQTRNVLDGFGREIEHWGPPPQGGQGDASVLLSTTRYETGAQGSLVEVRERPDWDSAKVEGWPYNRLYQDGLGRPWLAHRSGPLGGPMVITEMSYDSMGRVLAVSYPRREGEAAAWQTHSYDDFDRPLEVLEPDGSKRRYDYLRGELRVRSRLIHGEVERVTTQERSIREVLVKSTADGNQASIEYRYNPLTEPKWVRGPRGDITEYRYDSLGRPVYSKSADSGERWLSYDRKGRLALVRTQSGVRLGYEYDALGRATLERIERPQRPVRQFRYHYDGTDVSFGLSHLTKVTTEGNEQAFGYDRYGRAAMETLTLDGRSYTQRNEFNPGGLRTLLIYPDGAIARFGYDGLDNPVRFDFQPTPEAASRRVAEVTAMNALNQVEAVNYGNGLAARQSYYTYAQSMQRPQQMRVLDAEGGQDLLRLDYGWNGVGQLDSMKRNGEGGAELSYRFAYDNVGWLKQADGPFGRIEIDYDQAGNITRNAGIEYRYGQDNNQLESGSDGLTAGHDADGNVTSLHWPARRWDYQYEREALLAAVELDGETVSRFDYDFAGNRLRRVDADGTVSIYVSADYDVTIEGERELHTRYVTSPKGRLYASTVALDAAQAQAQHRYSERLRDGPRWWQRAANAVAALFAGTNALLGLSVLLAIGFVPVLRRRRGRARDALTMLVLACFVAVYHVGPAQAQLSPGKGLPAEGQLYFHHDHLDSTILVTDAAGAISSVVAYRPHGAIDEPRSSGPDDFRSKYTGKELDEPTGLINLGARYLHPELGRFLAPDPQHQFATPYAYAGNDPYSLRDPDGEFAVETALLIAIIVGASIGAVSGAYAGASAVNHSMNPAEWDWSEGSTYAGLFAGAAIGAVGGAITGAAGEAGIAAGIAGEVAVGFVEGAAFTAMGGGSPQEIVEGALFGAVTGGIGAAGSRAVSGLARSSSALVRRGEASIAEQAKEASQLSRAARRGAVADDNVLAESRTVRAVESGTNEQRLIGNSSNHDLVGDMDVCFSFPAGTKIATESGVRAIEGVQPGDRLLAPLPDVSGAIGAYSVLFAYQREADALYRIRFDGNEVLATAEHPFWVESTGWVPARGLVAGDRLRSVGGEHQPVVESVELQAVTGIVYNFEVDEAGQYFAGDDGDQVLVHNGKCSRRLKAMGATPSKRSATGRTVIQRMRSKGWVKKIGGVEHVKVRVTVNGPRVWKKLYSRDIHMGHIHDAVAYWNTTGYKYGARAKQVRVFMLDHTNYELEWGPLNSSNGARLRATYRPPKGWTGAW